MSNNWTNIGSYIQEYTKGITPKYVQQSNTIVLNQKCIRDNQIDYSFAQFVDDNQNIREDKYIRIGDILINSTGQGTAGRIAFVESLPNDKKVTIDSHILILRCEDIITANLIRYSLFSFEKTLMTFIDGSSGQGEFDKIRLFGTKIKLPTNNNILIVKLLSSIDKKIKLNNKIISELEQMAKELYDYWFVQFDFPDADGKPYRSSGGKMVYSQVLKCEIPEGWDVSAIGKWIELEKGGDWGSDEESGNYSLKVYCIRGADINGVNGNGSINAPLRFINKNNTDKLLSNGDVIIEISGGSPTQSTGRAALVTDAVIERFSNPIICSNFCKALTLKDLTFRYNFIYEWQRVYDSGVLFGFEGKTSGIKNFLYDAFIKSFNVATPPKYLKEKFVAIIDTFNYKKHKLLNENKELATLRDWLLPMLMNGQVTVQTDTKEETGKATPIINLSRQRNQRFELWLSNQGAAARGEIDKATLREIFDAMDEDDK